jgi:hypothetical protein
LNCTVIGLDGPISCPRCGERYLLTASGIIDDYGEKPSSLTCMCGHAWQETTLPRRLIAGVLAEAAALDPEAWEEVLHFAEHHGKTTGGADARALARDAWDALLKIETGVHMTTNEEIAAQVIALITAHRGGMPPGEIADMVSESILELVDSQGEMEHVLSQTVGQLVVIATVCLNGWSAAVGGDDPGGELLARIGQIAAERRADHA